MIRDPVNIGELQSDLDGKGFNILNVNAVGNVQQQTLYVDPSLPAEIGVRATGVPFQSLPTALAAAMPGDTINLRPGLHAFDGVLTIANLPGLTIYGPGAIIRSATIVNEIGKLLVHSGNVTIEGIEFDGQVVVGSLPVNFVTTVGAIEANHAPNLVIRNCNIHDQAAIAVKFTDVYGGSCVDNCILSACYGGVSAATATASIIGLAVRNNTISRNRTYGLALFGSNNPASFTLTDVRVTGNDFFGDVIDTPTPVSFAIGQAVVDVFIEGNYLSKGYDGITVSVANNVSIKNNILESMAHNGISLLGCKNVIVEGNLINGTGASMSNSMLISGQYAVANDAGPYVIASNQCVNVPNTGLALSLANANNCTIEGNRFGGVINLASFTNIELQSNSFLIASTTPAITIDAAERGWKGIVVGMNQFFVSGSPTLSRIIVTVDASGTGGDQGFWVGNVTPSGLTYTSGTYAHFGAHPPTNISQRANTPESTTRAMGSPSPISGWVNDRLVSNVGDLFNVPSGATGFYQVANQIVVRGRKSGWSRATGNPDRTAFNTETVTLLVLARHMKALIDDLYDTVGHGLIGIS